MIDALQEVANIIEDVLEGEEVTDKTRMAGHNQLEINQATMCKIVQLWLDQETSLEQDVQTVEKSGSPHAGEKFLIKMKERESGEEKAQKE